MPDFSLPFGDAFLVDTKYTDRAANLLYQEQKNRELTRQRQQASLDDDFAKNMAGVKDVDVPEIAKKYGDWKIHYQQLQKKGSVTPEEQLDNLRKKAEIYQAINGSKQDLAGINRIKGDYNQRPDNYDDNTPSYLTARLKTPTSQLQGYKNEKGEPVDLSDENIYRYKGTNTDFQKPLSLAAGTPRQVNQKEEPVGKDNLQFKITPYLYGNTPTQFKESLLSSLSDRSMRRDAESIIAQTPTEVLKTVDEEFKAIPAERWKRMGVDKPQELSIDKATSNAEKYAIHQAQLYALNNEPKEGTPVFRDNKSAIDARDFEQAKALKNYEHFLKIGDDEKAGKWVDEYLNNKKDEIKKGKPQAYVEAGMGWEMPLDVNLRKIFTVKVGGKEVEPDKLILRHDGKYVPIFYTYKDSKIEHKDNGFPVVDYSLTVPHSQDDVKVAMGVKTGVKQMNVEMGGGTNKTHNVESTTTLSTVPVATKAEWKAAGWSDGDINKALKAGKIKVK